MLRVLLCLLLVSSAFAQEKIVSVRDFSGGVNTVSSDFAIKPNECRFANNVDFGRYLGAITKRYGYDSIGFKAATDSFMGILGITWEDGTSQMVIATDDSAKGYGGIYLLPKGSVKLDSATRIWDYWSTLGPTNFTVFQDRLYGVNGYQKGFVYQREGNTDIVRSLPIQAPGEPLIAPVDSGHLTGEYRYTFRMWRFGGGKVWGDRGYVSGPYKVNDGGFAIRFIPGANVDSAISSIDSTFLEVWRTHANPGRIDERDQVYRVVSMTLKNPSASTVFIDTIPDTSYDDNANLIDKTYLGADSLRSGWGHTRYGGPGYVSSIDTVYSHASDTMKRRGIFYGTPYTTDSLNDSADFDNFCIAVAYATSLYDSTLNMESDTGRSLFVYEDTTGEDNIKSIRLSLPKRPDSVTNLRYRLYRAHLMQIARDTNVLVREFVGLAAKAKAEAFASGHGDYYFVQVPNVFNKWRVFQRALVNDTIMLGPYHMVAEISGDSAYFTDSLRYDSLVLNPIFHRSVPPPLLKWLFPYDGRLIGFAMSGLHWSFPDTGGAWGTFDQVEINPGDGEQIEAAYPARNVIRIMKSRSSWNLYQDANLDWSLAEVASRIGCIATRSYQRGMNGHYYLSEFGVIQENEGQYLERTQATGLISSKLDNFDKLPITTKRNAKSFYVDQTYLLSIGDTAYAYSEKADAWATWTNFPIGGATMFRAATQVDFIPPDTMYFYKPNGKTLFRYKSSEKDVSTAITWQWQSGPMVVSPTYKVLSAIGTYALCDTAVSLGGYVYNEKGTLLSTGLFSSDVSQRYSLQGGSTILGGLGFSVKYLNNDVKKIVVDGMDIYYTEHGLGVLRK